MWTVDVEGYGRIVDGASAEVAIGVARAASAAGQDATLRANGIAVYWSESLGTFVTIPEGN